VRLFVLRQFYASFTPVLTEKGEDKKVGVNDNLPSIGI